MRKNLRFIGAYLSLNFSAAMEYRAAFISQTVGMILNNALVLVFWWMFFLKFPQVGGWRLADVLRLWAVVAVAFGLGNAIFGNAMRLATLIAHGQLDYYLALPKDALLHVLVSRMGTSSWGDVATGVIAYFAAGHVDALRFGLFVVLCTTGCAIFVSYHVIAGSLAFWAGNAETLAPQASNALIAMATYPGSIFEGWVRVLTFTVIPAALLGHVPADLIREPNAAGLAGVVAFAVTSVFIAIAVFRLGLRRYQSGNLVELRG